MMTKTNHYFRALAVLAALAIAATLLVQLAKPAEAAFPGQNGNIVFTSDRDGDSEIRKMSSCLICKKKLTNNSAEDITPAVSPDGKKIAFVSDRNGNKEIYVMNRDGSNQIRLTNNAAIDAAPAWSPDGTKIAFQSDRDGAFDENGNYVTEIYVMNADGTDETNLTHDPYGNFKPAYSPDGTKIAFSTRRDGNSEIYVMNANGSGTPVNLTNHPADDSAPDWSPDGAKIVFESTRNGTLQAPNLEVYVMDSDGSDQTRLTNNAASGFLAIDYAPVFSPDGSKIAFVSYRDGNYEIYRMDANGSNLTNLSNHSSADHEPNWGVRPQ